MATVVTAILRCDVCAANDADLTSVKDGNSQSDGCVSSPRTSEQHLARFRSTFCWDQSYSGSGTFFQESISESY